MNNYNKAGVFLQMLLQISKHLFNLIKVGFLGRQRITYAGGANLFACVPIQSKEFVGIPVLLMVVNQTYIWGDVKTKSHSGNSTFLESPQSTCTFAPLWIVANSLIRFTVSRLYLFMNCLADVVGRQMRLCL